jgi:hypothetical protein
VAVEYDFLGAAEMSTEDMLAFMADAVGGVVTDYGYVQGDGLQVTAYRVTSGDEASAALRFGFVHRVTATFRFANLASEEQNERNEELMITSVARFLETYPGAGVLLFNHEEVVLQRLDAGIVLNSDWEGWADLPGLDGLTRRLPSRALPQPLL